MIVRFRNTSKGPVKSVEWDFGDGATSDVNSPFHRYTIAGSYSVQLTASGPGGIDKSVMVNLITVGPGPAASLEVSPSNATLVVQGTVQFTAAALDQFGNDAPGTITWSLAAGGGSISPGGLFTADTVAGAFPGTVAASLQTDAGGLFATASVTVEPDAVSRVVVEPADVILEIRGVQTFKAQVLDRFGNLISDASISWKSDADAGTIDGNGRFTSATTAGSFPGAVQIEAVKGIESASATADVSVKPGKPSMLEVSPPTATLAVQEVAQFAATARDAHGNAVPGAFVWSVAAGPPPIPPIRPTERPKLLPSIDSDGILAAGTVAGVFVDVVKASLQTSAGELVATASVTVEPGPLSSVVLEPTEVTVDIGAAQAFTFTALDEFGNEISDVLSSWSAQSDTGVIDATGLFSAGTIAGVYPAGIGVAVVKGTARARATADVSVPPGPLATIEVHPSFSVVERQAAQQFSAAGFDRHRNEITGLALLWEATGGEITQGGLFTAGAQSGAYEVRAAATFQDNTRSGSATVPIPPVWIPVGNMSVARAAHHSVLLPNGKVLIVSQGAELFDPVTRTFSAAGNASCADDQGSRATLLADGRVLITGEALRPRSRCAEIYDSETGAFSRVGDLNADHWMHATSLLSDGRVLIVGGLERVEGGEMTHAVVEFYDPVTETFSVTGSLNTDRRQHTATSLPSGQVLITGGAKYLSPFIYGSEWPGVCQASAELYDPSTGTFSPVGGGVNACGHSAILLNNDKVLITSHDRVAYLFDPVTGFFEAAGVMTTGRGFATASLLPNGHVLITGGWSRFPQFLATAELYDPVAGTFTATDGMNQARQEHTATVLSNGHVLVAGGTTTLTTSSGESVGQADTTSAELWIPSVLTISSRAIQPPAGLVSWLPGDGNASDIVGGNHGTLWGDATFAPGIVGQAFKFAGSGHVDMGDVADFEITSTGSMSITGWINMSEHNDAYIVRKFDEVSPDFGWNISVTGSLRYEIVNADDRRSIETTGVDDNQWHHFAATHDGSAGEMNLYVDGVLRGSATENFAAINDGGIPVTIGEGLPGLVDEVAFFNRALSAAEVKAIYDAGGAGMARPTPAPTSTAKPTPVNSCQEELELQVSLVEGGTAEQAVVTSYQCMTMYVDSRGKQPSISSSLPVSEGVPLSFRLGSERQPTTLEIRLYPGAGVSGDFFKWPEDLPPAIEPLDTLQPAPSLTFQYLPQTLPGEYSLVVRATWDGPIVVFYAIGFTLD